MKKNNKISLEKSFSQLDKIVHEIEDDSISLDKMISLFKKGISLTEMCDAKLKEAEKKVEDLLNKSNSLK